jgi:hypothetical protein
MVTMILVCNQRHRAECKTQLCPYLHSAISDNVSVWDFLRTGGNEDFSVGTVSLNYSGDDLVNTVPPAGLPFQGSLPYGERYGEAGWWRETWELTGSVFVDHLDFSLIRFMAEENLDATRGVRTPMTGVAFQVYGDGLPARVLLTVPE